MVVILEISYYGITLAYRKTVIVKDGQVVSGKRWRAWTPPQELLDWRSQFATRNKSIVQVIYIKGDSQIVKGGCKRKSWIRLGGKAREKKWTPMTSTLTWGACQRNWPLQVPMNMGFYESLNIRFSIDEDKTYVILQYSSWKLILTFAICQLLHKTSLQVVLAGLILSMTRTLLWSNHFLYLTMLDEVFWPLTNSPF